MTGSPRKTLLIVTQYFAPKNEIASIRLTHLAAGLARLGWDIDVLTVASNRHNPLERRSDLGMDQCLTAGVRVVTAPVPFEASSFYAIREAAVGIRRSLKGTAAPREGRSSAPRTSAPTQRNGAGSSPRPTSMTARLRNIPLSAIDRGYVRVFGCASGLRETYDALWVSFGPRYMVDVGLRLADRFPAAAFVMDVRDPIVRRQGVEDAMTRRAQESAERRVIARADAFTVVSRELLSENAELVVPVEQVTNGFEATGTKADASVPPTHGPIRLYYGGRMYHTQKIDSLAAAVRALSERREIVVDYAGPDAATFVDAFAAQGAGHLVFNHGVVSRAESLRLGERADLNIVLSWNTAERGIMTGKVYELIANNRPIVCLVAGDHATSALANVFEGDELRRVFACPVTPGTVKEIERFIDFAADASESIRQKYSGQERYRRYSYEAIAERLSGNLAAVVERKHGERGL